MATPPPATAFSHVGVTVPDLEKAIDWYRETLGYYLLTGPLEVLEDDSPLGIAAANIYGVGFTSFRFAHLCGADGAGLELFHFASPATVAPKNNFEFWKTGLNHFSLTAVDFDGVRDRIVAAGGRARSAPVVIDPVKGYCIQYMEDPWGTVVELCSHPYTQMWA
ncbi:VOC family protein [Herbiconiux sp. P15]|uniref:VOC family protein n=1 Tax=Herbiconiux liukaitaii TaxID=3342799 RepID=UPI0035B93BC8